MIHNHSLMRPEEIERGWPKQVHEMICRLARERMTTQEIRQQVQAQFPNITWNERRFYNRLSEERQKIRQQETVERAHRLTATWTKICMAAAGCDELTDYAQNHVLQLLNTICNMAQVSIETLEKNVPVLIADDQPISTTNEEPLSISSSPPLSSSASPTITASMNHHQRQQEQEEDWPSCDENNNSNNDMRRYSLSVSEPDADMIKPTSRQGSWQAGADLTPTSTIVTSTKSQQQQEVPKNFTLVVIPKHAYLVKVHNQRSLNEMQIQRTHRRSRSIGPGDDGSDLHMRKQTKLNHHQHQSQPQHMIPINSTMPPPPSPHRSMMPPPQPQPQQSQMPPPTQQYQTQHHTMVYPPPPPSTYDHNTMSLPPTSTANYIQQPLPYTNMQHRQPSSRDCNDLSQQQQQQHDDPNIAFPPLDTSSSTVASTPSPVSAGTPPTATTSVIPFGGNNATTTPTTTMTTTTTTTATSSNNSVDNSFMPIQQPQQQQQQHRTKKSHRRHSYNNVHPSFSYPMMSPQTMYHQKQHQQGKISIFFSK